MAILLCVDDFNLLQEFEIMEGQSDELATAQCMECTSTIVYLLLQDEVISQDVMQCTECTSTACHSPLQDGSTHVPPSGNTLHSLVRK